MSGAEVLGVISAVISIVDATIKVYNAAKDEAGLPPNFKTVATKLPLIATLLEDAERYIEDAADEGLTSTVTPIVEDCNAKATQLQKLFEKVIVAEKDSRFERYVKVARTIGKGGRVETLMEGILKNLQLLTMRLPQATSRRRQENLTEAIEDVTNMKSSLPDKFEDASAFANYISGAQAVNTGTGSLYNHQNNGPGAQYNGNNYIVHFDGPSSQVHLEDWAQSAMQTINFKRQGPSMKAMLESSSAEPPDDLLQSYLHTKAFQSWLQGKRKMLLTASIQGGSAAEAGDARNQRLAADDSSLTAALVRHAGRHMPCSRVFYIDCLWALDQSSMAGPQKLTRVQQLQQGQAETDSGHSAEVAALGLLFVQLICSQSQPEQVLLEYMAQLRPTTAVKLQSALLDTGQPPPEIILPAILYILNQVDWAETFLSIENIEMMSTNDQRRLLSNLEALCGARKTQACVATSSGLRGMTTEATSLLISEDTEYQEFLVSLHFPDMEARRTQVSPAAAETNSWIWANPEYMEFWRQKSGIFWIRGKPGSGKSVLAKFIKEALLERLRSEQGPSDRRFLVGDWFYHRRGGGHYVQHCSLLRSILYHLSKQSREVFTSFCLAKYRSMNPHKVSWSESTLKDTIINICRGPMPVVCVIDAVDEAENAEIVSVIKAFTDNISGSNAKFIMLSRPAVRIEQQVVGCHSILMEAENQGDIEKIVRKGLESLRCALHALDVGKSPPAAAKGGTQSRPRGPRMRQPRSRSVLAAVTHEKLALESIQNTLIENARGSVLWVKLVLEQLLRQASSPWTCTLDGLRQAMEQIPHELEQYYAQIVTDVLRQSAAYVRETQRTLMWICAASEMGDVTLEMLWEVVTMIKDNFASSTMEGMRSSRPFISGDNGYNELWRKIYLICGPFVEVYNPGLSAEESRGYDYGAGSVVQLMHQSVRDFLTETPAAGELSFSMADARAFVQRHLSHYLRITGQFLGSGEVGDRNPVHCTELLQYLEDRKLLTLALCADLQEPVDAFDLQIPPLQESAPLSADAHLCSAMLSSASTFEDLTKDIGFTSYIKRHLPANRLFYGACRDGLITAVLNMLALGWHREWPHSDSPPAVMYGITMAASLCQSERVHVDCDGGGVSNDMSIDSNLDNGTTYNADDELYRSNQSPAISRYFSYREKFNDADTELKSETSFLETASLHIPIRSSQFSSGAPPLLQTNGELWPEGRRNENLSQGAEQEAKVGVDESAEARGESDKVESSQGAMAASSSRLSSVSDEGPWYSAPRWIDRVDYYSTEERREEMQRHKQELKQRLSREEHEWRKKERDEVKKRYAVEALWVAHRWHVTVWVDKFDDGMSWMRGAGTKSSGLTSTFSEWCSFLDLSCGSKARSLRQLGKWVDDDDEGQNTSEEFLQEDIELLQEDVEQAIALAVQVCKSAQPGAFK